MLPELEKGGEGHRGIWQRRTGRSRRHTGARVPGTGPSAEELGGRSKGFGERRTGAGLRHRGGGQGRGSPRRSSAAGMAAAAQYFGSPSGRNRGREAIRKFMRAAAHI